MALVIQPFVLGPLFNNTYLVADPTSHQAAVIDPTFDSERVAAWAAQNTYEITQIWLTHAHFDHIAGVSAIVEACQHPLKIALHSADLLLYQQGGGASNFGLFLDPGPKPDLALEDGQILTLGENQFEVRFTPGHTPGHVVFYNQAEGVVFSGDLIFQHSVGRTDLPGGSFEKLLNSIQTKILTLPPETRLLSGHGPETTVGEEARANPFLE